MPTQDNWRWCNKCQGLAFSGSSTSGACPAGGQHDLAASYNYALVNTGPAVSAGPPTHPVQSLAGTRLDTVIGRADLLADSLPKRNQDDWRWCKKCQGLAFAGSSTPGACPAGGQHDHTGSDNYNLGFLPIYRFSLDSFQILTTRSGSVLSFLSSATDTDYVGFSLTVGNQPAQVQTQSMGDLKDGSYSVNLSFDQIAVSPNETVVIAYHIVNSSQGLSAADAYLQQTLHSLMNAAVQAVSKAASEEVGTTLGGLLGTAIPVPLLGSALGALAGWLAAEAWNFIFPNCDGPVAAGIHIFTVQQLLDATRNGVVFQTTDNNPGVDSQHGCGSNSNYNVTWSIAMG